MRTLKSLLRTPLKSGIVLALFSMIVLMSVSRACEYYVTMRELNSAESYYKITGGLENSSALWQGYVKSQFKTEAGKDHAVKCGWYGQFSMPISTEALDIIANSKYVRTCDARTLSAGISNNIYRMHPIDESIPCDFIYNCFFEGTVQSIDYTFHSGRGIPGRYGPVTVVVDKMIGGPSQFSEKVGNEIEIYPYEATTTMDGYGWYDPIKYLDGLKVGNKYFFSTQTAFIFGLGYMNSIRIADYRYEVGYSRSMPTSDGKLYIELNDNNYDYINAPQLDDVIHPKYTSIADTLLLQKANDKTLDVVYTKSSSLLPYFINKKIYLSEGRGLTENDNEKESRVCIVNSDLANKQGLKVGQSIELELRDYGIEQYGKAYGIASLVTTLSNPITKETFEIVGIYSHTDVGDPLDAYDFNANTIFVPTACKPDNITPSPITPPMFSFSLTSPKAMKAFVNEVKPSLDAMEIVLVIDDMGWTKSEETFKKMSRSALLDLTAFGIAALFAAVLTTYLFVSRKRHEYAIMRALGNSKRAAGAAVFIQLFIPAAIAAVIGGTAAWFSATNAAEKTMLAAQNGGFLPADYHFSGSLPPLLTAGFALLSLAIICVLTLLWLHMLARRSPLELLSENRAAQNKGRKNEIACHIANANISHMVSTPPVPTKKPESGAVAVRYILRHMRHSVFKTSLSLLLAALILGAVGQLAAIIFLNSKQIDKLYTETEVTGSIIRRDGDLENRKIPYPAVQRISSAGFVKSCHLERQESLYLEDKYMYQFPGGLTAIALNSVNGFYCIDDELATISYAKGYDDGKFAGEEPLCVIGEKLMWKLGLKIYDKILCAGYNNAEEYLTLKICGSVNGVLSENSILLPLGTLNKNAPLFCGDDWESKQSYAAASFVFTDLRELSRLKTMTDEMFSPEAFVKEMRQLQLQINDEELNAVVKPLEQNVALLERLFPVAVAVACLLGGGIPGLIIIQSAKEAAVMRILGTTKRRTRLTLVLEQLSLCLLGLLLGTATLLILHGAALAPILPKLALCAGLYFGACLLATTLCATIVTRGKALELLQTKE